MYYLKYFIFIIDALFLYIIKIFKVKYILYVHAQGLLKLSQGSSWLLNFIVRTTLSESIAAFILGEKLRHDINKFIPDNRLFILPNCIDDIATKSLDINKKIIT